MTKALADQVNILFEATKDLRSLEEIKPHCEAFNEWLNRNSNYSKESLGTVLSRAGLYKKFKSLPLEQGKNADLVPKHDGEGNVTSHELKHYVLVLCGLSKEDWSDRNSTTRVSDRLSNGQEIDPSQYLEVTGKLLESDDPHEVAVGLIAATGRRPHEILARATFKPIQDQDYQVMFAGQGKKRGDKPVFPIATLYPAKYIVNRLHWLRNESSTKQLLVEVDKENPQDIAAQNRAIDSRRNGSLNRVVREYFGDKGDATPILNFRYGEEQDNCKGLRAAYLALATERDCVGSTGAKMLHAARLAGHFVKENPTDRDLQNLITTLGYSDYYTTKPVSFPQMQEEKISNAKIFASDLERLKELQKQWKCNSQHEATHRLIRSGEENIELQRQLLDAQSRISQLEKQLEENNTVSQEPIVIPSSERSDEHSRLRKLQLNHAMSQKPKSIQVSTDFLHKSVATHQEESREIVSEKAKETVAETSHLEQRMEQLENVVTLLIERLENNLTEFRPKQASAKQQPQIKENERDWQGIESEELRKLKSSGAIEEKLNRAFTAIANYNDNKAPSNTERWYIGNVTLRELSGCNGKVVANWIANHKTLVDDHNNKYSLGQYHNKSHKGKSITDAITW